MQTDKTEPILLSYRAENDYSMLICTKNENLAQHICSPCSKPTGLVASYNDSISNNSLQMTKQTAECDNKTVASAGGDTFVKQEYKETKATEQTTNITNERLSVNTGYRLLDMFNGFKYPWGVAVDNSNGDVAVAEWGGNRVTIIDSQGRHKVSFGGKKGNKICLKNPWGLTFTDDNHLLITESTRILKYSIKHGKIVKSVGSKAGSNQRQFDLPAGLSIHPHSKKIYIADSNNHRIKVLNQDLTFHSMFGGKGTERGNFYLPWDISFDSKGMIYVTEGNSRIQKFTPEGHFVSAFGKTGNKVGEINRPASLAIDGNDVIHITDLYNGRISMFDMSGEFIGCYGNGSSDTADHSFNGPCGITIANDDSTVYVADCWNNRIKKLKY